jgi:hypothetical protein
MNELQYLNLADPVEEQGFRTILVTNATHQARVVAARAHHRL